MSHASFDIGPSRKALFEALEQLENQVTRLPSGDTLEAYEQQQHQLEAELTRLRSQLKLVQEENSGLTTLLEQKQQQADELQQQQRTLASRVERLAQEVQDILTRVTSESA